MRADTFTMWEQMTRYANDYMAARTLVLTYIEFADALVTKGEQYLVVPKKPDVTTIAQMNLFPSDD